MGHYGALLCAEDQDDRLGIPCDHNTPKFAKATENVPGMSWQWPDKHDTCPHSLIDEYDSVFDCCLI